MGLRIGLGRILIRLGSFIQSSAIMVMRPDDMVEFTRQTYARPEDVDDWSRSELVDPGLYEEEQALVEKLPHKNGRLLVLGVGGGREAIPLARMGFEVIGVDFIPELVRRAQQNGERRGLKIGGLVQEISKLDVPAGSFSVVWLSAAMYSSIPTRRRRLAMLNKIAKALKPDGYFVCQFAWGAVGNRSQRFGRLHRAVALLTAGYLSFEKGDILFLNREFSHEFSSKQELWSEFEAGGFQVMHLEIPGTGSRGGAILRKNQ